MLIIPAVDLKEGKCVRLIQGEMDKSTVYSDDPVAQAKEWEAGGAKLIHIVDLDGAFEGMPMNRSIIEEICKNVSVPIQLGGGIRTVETADEYFEAGVSRIVIGSLLLKDPATAKAIVEKYPGKVVAGIDVKDNKVTGDGWVTTSNLDGAGLAQELHAWPLAAIVFTDISRDGMMEGANIKAIEIMAKVASVPVVASGGVSSDEDLKVLSTIAGVEGAIIGKALYTGAIDLAKAVAEYQ